ncbi:hypothetical protein BOSEA31B_15182 [Hyphomicrobiales bacterium]|nr:hypothetical protein BOSEA31B_15182 [Hyphomicrobiales bacterium]CAH1701673.1 hypothetical protein BOSEA1005_21372 [Hyphomicrobiales bacterium]CAI0345839.1 hypothetical protein BO1005MUT1_450067 [Hyphomicrobiales bacterium]
MPEGFVSETMAGHARREGLEVLQRFRTPLAQRRGNIEGGRWRTHRQPLPNPISTNAPMSASGPM